MRRFQKHRPIRRDRASSTPWRLRRRQPGGSRRVPQNPGWSFAWNAHHTAPATLCAQFPSRSWPNGDYVPYCGRWREATGSDQRREGADKSRSDKGACRSGTPPHRPGQPASRSGTAGTGVCERPGRTSVRVSLERPGPSGKGRAHALQVRAFDDLGRSWLQSWSPPVSCSTWLSSATRFSGPWPST